MNLWSSLCFSMTINVWGIACEFYFQIFPNLFDIATGVHVAKHDLSTSYLLNACVLFWDDCWFVSCLLDSCLVWFVRYCMKVFLFRCLLFCLRWLILFLVWSLHSSRAVHIFSYNTIGSFLSPIDPGKKLHLLLLQQLLRIINT